MLVVLGSETQLIVIDGSQTQGFEVQLTGQLTDRWSIGAGFRYTDEEKEWTGRNQVFIQALDGGFDPGFTWRELGEPLAAANFSRYPTGVVKDSESWDEPTWRLTTSYEFGDDLNLHIQLTIMNAIYRQQQQRDQRELRTDPGTPAGRGGARGSSTHPTPCG